MQRVARVELGEANWRLIADVQVCVDEQGRILLRQLLLLDHAGNARATLVLCKLL